MSDIWYKTISIFVIFMLDLSKNFNRYKSGWLEGDVVDASDCFSTLVAGRPPLPQWRCVINSLSTSLFATVRDWIYSSRGFQSFRTLLAVKIVIKRMAVNCAKFINSAAKNSSFPSLTSVCHQRLNRRKYWFMLRLKALASSIIPTIYESPPFNVNI